MANGRRKTSMRQVRWKACTCYGDFFYSPHAEPYESGVVEEPIATEGETWVGAYKCDKCGHIQDLLQSN